MHGYTTVPDVGPAIVSGTLNRIRLWFARRLCSIDCQERRLVRLRVGAVAVACSDLIQYIYKLYIK